MQYKVPFLLREPLVSLQQKTLFDNVVATPHRYQIVNQLKLFKHFLRQFQWHIMNFKILKRNAFKVLMSLQKFKVIIAARFSSADPLGRCNSEQPFNQIFRFRSHFDAIGPLELQTQYLLVETCVALSCEWVLPRVHSVYDASQ